MNEELAKLISETETITKNVEKTFGDLNFEQLNWKPNPTSWSIGQCLEHLIITNKLEFPAIEDVLREDYRNPFWSKVPFLSDLCGNFLVNMCKPESKLKYKAPKSFRPSQSETDANIVEDFVIHQQEVTRIFERCQHLDLQKTKIISPISSLFTYSLFDSFRVLVLHEQRHFNQAKRVLEMQHKK